MMLAMLLALLPPVTCQPVHSDWILGRDLSTALSAFKDLPPDLPIGLSPVPGQQRTFWVPDLKRIALAHHLEGDFTKPVCFAWSLSVPKPDAMHAAMQETLRGRKPTIEILESSLVLAPPGDMIFPIDGLGCGAPGRPCLWRGYVTYADHRRFPIWARVLVTVQEDHLVAVSDLRPGDVIDASNLKIENYDGPLGRAKYLGDIGQAIGLVVRSPVSAGSAVLETMLEAPREVNRGDTVNAIVQNGGARLEVQAVAEDNGRKGQVITVRNPRSGRSFHARVEDKGTVVVVPGGQFGLVVETKKS
jgi:flagella basal body P-ring formation protein FlgA